MTKEFTSKDYVSIIAACHKNRVRKIKFDELEIEFDLMPAEVDEMGFSARSEPENVRDLEQTVRDDDPLYGEVERMTLLANDPEAYENAMEEEAMNAIQQGRSQQDVSGG